MQTSSTLPVEQNHHYQAVTGAGLQYRLNDRLSLRLEYTRYDADASQAALSLQCRFMRKSHNDQSTAILSKDSSGTALLRVIYPDASIASATTQNPSIEPQKITPPPLPAFALPMFYFDINKTTLKAHEKDKLTPLVDWLNSTNEPVVHIIGHTDSTGTKAYNQKLSEQRAEAVQQILIKMGSDRARLQIMGLGESRPAASNATPSGRQQNRRVELTFELPR
jgi:outer membrane protein OmpA-like peptidoglycan-associated protein